MRIVHLSRSNQMDSVSYWLAASIFVPFHEFGHARAAQAFGLEYAYGNVAFGKEVKKIPNYWALSLYRLITPPFFIPGSGGARTSAWGQARFSVALNDYWGSNSLGIIISAGGLNNQSLLAKRIAQGIYRGHGHITQMSHYIGNKISGFIYSSSDKNNNHDTRLEGGDITGLIKEYKAKGYNIDYSDVSLQSLLSLLSAISFTFFKGYYDYVTHGDAKVYPFELFGVRLPDLNSYINARGLSFEIVSGYRWDNDLFFDLAYEFIWKGGSAHQVTPSAHFNIARIAPALNKLWISANTVIGKGIGGGAGAEWMPFAIKDANFWQRFSYFVDFTVYNGFNLYGERNITSLSHGNTFSFSGFGGLRLNY